MGINPISELSGMFSTSTVTTKTEGTGFQSFMEDASSKGKMGDSFMDNLPTASDSKAAYEKASSSVEKKNINTDNDQTQVNKNSDSLSTDHKDVKTVDAGATKELKDKIIDEAAKELGISEEEIVEVLSQLGIGAADLLNTENVSLLVANVIGDGDVMSLLMDENASNVALELGQAIEGILNEQAEVNGLTPDVLKEFVINTKDMEVQVDTVEITTDNNGLVVDESLVSTVNAENKSESQGEALAGNSGESSGNTTEAKTATSQRSENTESIAQTVTNNMVEADVTVEAIDTPEIITESSQIDTIDIINQIQDHVRAEFKDDMTQLQMQLNPENLGTVNLTVAAKEGNVTAQLVTQNESVQAALESQIALLRESLEQQGVKVEAIEVMVASHGFEQNLEQGNDYNDQQEQENERLRKATRKIDLGSFATGDIEELDEAEQVTVQMMQADGNSMDYKV